MFICFMIFLVQVNLPYSVTGRWYFFQILWEDLILLFFVIEFLMKPSKRPFTMQESVPTLKYDNHRNR